VVSLSPCGDVIASPTTLSSLQQQRSEPRRISIAIMPRSSVRLSLWLAQGHGRPQNFFQGGKVDVLHILFRLLAMQRKWNYTKRKCPLLRQMLHIVFSL